jgi:hypothetical protein
MVSGDQTGHGTVTVTDSNGHPASYLQVHITANAKVTLLNQGGLTNRKGIRHFTYKFPDYGRANFTATVTAPSSNSGLLTDASPGRQRLLTGNYTEHAVGHDHFKTAGAKAKAKNICVENCDGIATAQFTGIAPKQSAARMWFHTDSGVTAHCDARAGKTCTVSKKVPDGTKFTKFEFCLSKHGKCVTKRISVKKDKEFVCPGKPALKFSGVCDCFGNGTLVPSPESPAGSTRVWKAWETDNGSRVGSVVRLTNGQFTDLAQLNIKQGHSYEIFVKTKAGGHNYTYSKDLLQPFSPWHLDRSAA